MNKIYLKDSLCIDIKAIGFNELCIKYKKSDGTVFDEEHSDYHEYVRDNGVTPYSTNSSLDATEYTIPTLDEALEWLRSKHVYIYAYPINLGNKGSLQFRTTVITTTSIDNILNKYFSYEEAINKGIEDAYNYLKPKP